MKLIRGERGIVLISTLAVSLVLAIGASAFYAFALNDYRATQRNEWMTQVLYVAEAGIDQKLVELTQLKTANLTGTLNLASGGNYQGRYDIFYGVVKQGSNPQDRVLVNPSSGEQKGISGYGIGDEVILSTGILTLDGTERARKNLRVSVKRAALVSPRAAVAISGVASTNGAVIVDGREHDANGNLTGAPGTYGISTSTGTFNQGGNSKVGGNGVAPSKPANPVTYELNAPPLPPTPEGILGVSDGSLDQFKTNTPPATPYSGIVYLTSSWDGVNLNGSSGILICHNTGGTAFLKNIHGNFKGLIITDDIIHINGDSEMIGAVFGLKTGGVTLGNGSGWVKFSSEVLANLPLVRYTVTSWQDAQND